MKKDLSQNVKQHCHLKMWLAVFLNGSKRQWGRKALYWKTTSNKRRKDNSIRKSVLWPVMTDSGARSSVHAWVVWCQFGCLWLFCYLTVCHPTQHLLIEKGEKSSTVERITVTSYKITVRDIMNSETVWNGVSWCKWIWRTQPHLWNTVAWSAWL